MDFLNILKIIAALTTIATGLISMIQPRAVLGGFFIALGAAPLVYQSRDMYLMLGLAYLAVVLVRTVSIVLDKSFVKTNYISLITETN